MVIVSSEPLYPEGIRHGFDHWFATQNVAMHSHRDPYNFVRNGIPVGPTVGYSAAIVAGEAVDWLTNIRDKAGPFFLYVAFHEPHEPIATDPRFMSLYERNHPDDPSRVAYYGNVTQMDDVIGRILHALDSRGVADNTLVFFTSDNGPARTRWHNAGSLLPGPKPPCATGPGKSWQRSPVRGRRVDRISPLGTWI